MIVHYVPVYSNTGYYEKISLVNQALNNSIFSFIYIKYKVTHVTNVYENHNISLYLIEP